MKKHAKILSVLLLLTLALSAVVVAVGAEGETLTVINGGSSCYDSNVDTTETAFEKSIASNSGGQSYIHMYDLGNGKTSTENTYINIGFSTSTADDIKASQYYVIDMELATAAHYYKTGTFYADLRNTESGIQYTMQDTAIFKISDDAFVGSIDGVSTTTPLSLAPYDFQRFTLIYDIGYYDADGVYQEGDTVCVFIDGKLVHRSSWKQSAGEGYPVTTVNCVRFGPGFTQQSNAEGLSVVMACPYAALYAANDSLAALLTADKDTVVTFPSGFGYAANTSFDEVKDEYLYQVGDLMTRDFEAAVAEAAATGTAVDLLHNVAIPLEIPSACTVNTNGYTFNYSSAGYDAEVTQDTDGNDVVTFTVNDAEYTVNWYVGDVLVKTETVAHNTLITSPFDDVIEVGRVVDGVTTTAMDGYIYDGWATSADGEAVTLDRITADVNYYAVNYTQIFAKVTNNSTAAVTYVTEAIMDAASLYTAAGLTFDIYQDVSWNTSSKYLTRLTFNLHGNNFTATQRLWLTSTSGNVVTIKNGTVTISIDAFWFVEKGRENATIVFEDITSITKTTGKLAELRSGNMVFDNVNIDDYTGTLIGGLFYDSGDVSISIKDSDITVGYIAYQSSTRSGQTAACHLDLNVENSSVTAQRLVTLSPSVSDQASGITVNVNIDETSYIGQCDYSTTYVEDGYFSYFKNTIPKAGISINIAEGASFEHKPATATTGIVADITYPTDCGITLDTSDGIFKVMKAAEAGAEILNTSGALDAYVVGDYNKALDSYIPDGYTLKLLANMSTYEPASDTNFNPGAYTIDLNGKVFSLAKHFRFQGYTTAGETDLTIKNGSIEFVWNIINTTAYAPVYTFDHVTINVRTECGNTFDLRGGDVTFNDCDIVLHDYYSNKEIFALGNGTNTSRGKLTLNNTTIDLSTAEKISDDSVSASCHIFTFRNGNPTYVTATGCTFVTTNGRIARTVYNSARTLTPAHTLSFTDCKLTMTAETGRPFYFSTDENYLGSLTMTLSKTDINAADYKDDQITYVLGEGEAMLNNKTDGRGFRVDTPEINPQANLTLKTDFNLNFWFPTTDKIVAIQTSGEDVVDVADIPVVNGSYYKYVVGNIAANAAADDVYVWVRYTASNGKDYSVKMTYSVVKYATQLLADTTKSNESKALVASAIDYVSTAYTYAGTEAPEALTTLIASDAYTAAAALTEYDKVAEIPATATDVGNTAVAIAYAQLSLGSDLKFLFTLNEIYTGELTLAYAGETHTYDVVAGQVNGSSTVEVCMKSCDLYNEVITITVEGGETGTYDLAAYAANVKGGATLSEMLLALYNYCKEADEYAAIGTLN